MTKELEPFKNKMRLLKVKNPDMMFHKDSPDFKTQFEIDGYDAICEHLKDCDFSQCTTVEEMNDILYDWQDGLMFYEIIELE